MLLIMLLLVTLLRSVALLMALPICCDKNVPAAGLLGPRLFVAGSFGPKVISSSCVRVRLAVAKRRRWINRCEGELPRGRYIAAGNYLKRHIVRNRIISRWVLYARW